MVDWKYMKYHDDQGAFDYEDEVLNYAENLKAQGLKFSYEQIVEIHHNGGYKTSVVTGADFNIESTPPTTEGRRLLKFHCDHFVYCHNCNRYDSSTCSSCGSVYPVSHQDVVEHRHFMTVNGGEPMAKRHVVGTGSSPWHLGDVDNRFSCPIVNSVKQWASDSFSGQSIVKVIGSFCVIEAKLSKCQVLLTGPTYYWRHQDNDTRIEVLFETGSGHYETDFTIDPADPRLFDILQSLIDGTYFQGGNRACTNQP